MAINPLHLLQKSAIVIVYYLDEALGLTLLKYYFVPFYKNDAMKFPPIRLCKANGSLRMFFVFRLHSVKVLRATCAREIACTLRCIIIIIIQVRIWDSSLSLSQKLTIFLVSFRCILYKKL